MKKVYILEGLDCGNCAAKIEKKVSGVDGVVSVQVNFITTKMAVEYSDDNFLSAEKEIIKIIKKIDSDINVKS